jgi:hypothetical protein
MSACNILLQKQHRAVHLMVDGVSYEKTGEIVEVSQKCVALPVLHMALTVMGPVHGGLVMASELQKYFKSFDAFVDGVEEVMPTIFARHLNFLSGSGIPDCRLYIGGWSERENAPKAFSMLCVPQESEAYWQMATEREAAAYSDEATVKDLPFALVDLAAGTAGSVSVINPPWPVDLNPAECGLQIEAAPDDVPDAMNPEIDLLHIMEMQRRRKVPLRAGLPPAHWVGGVALLTSVTESGIAQKIVHRWDEDEIGGLIEPRPIDWKAWRAARTPVVPEGMSRLRRQMLDRKNRKAAR